MTNKAVLIFALLLPQLIMTTKESLIKEHKVSRKKCCNFDSKKSLQSLLFCTGYSGFLTLAKYYESCSSEAFLIGLGLGFSTNKLLFKIQEHTVSREKKLSLVFVPSYLGLITLTIYYMPCGAEGVIVGYGLGFLSNTLRSLTEEDFANMSGKKV